MDVLSVPVRLSAIRMPVHMASVQRRNAQAVAVRYWSMNMCCEFPVRMAGYVLKTQPEWPGRPGNRMAYVNDIPCLEYGRLKSTGCSVYESFYKQRYGYIPFEQPVLHLNESGRRPVSAIM